MKVNSTPKILIVDDETALLKMIEFTIKNKFDISYAKSATEGLDILKRKDIEIVVSDYRMPKMDGIEFLNLVKNEYPIIRRILLSSHLDYNSLIESINEAEVNKVMEKPFKIEELTKEILNQHKLFLASKEKDDEISTLKESLSDLERKSLSDTDKLLDLLIGLTETDKIANFSDQFIKAIDGLRSLSNLNLNIYFQDGDKKARRNVLNYLSDIEVIANQYDQKVLALYVLLFRSYFYLYDNNIENSMRMFKGVTSFYSWMDKSSLNMDLIDLIKKYPYIDQDNFITTEEKIKPIKLNKKEIKEICGIISSIDIGDLVSLSESFLTFFDFGTINVSYLIILKNDLPVYQYVDKTAKMDPSLVSGFFVALSHFLKEISSGEGDIEKIKHDSGVILIHSIATLKYILMAESDEAHFRMGLRQFSNLTYSLFDEIKQNNFVDENEEMIITKIFKDVFSIND